MTGDRADLVSYRLQRAREALEDAEVLAQGERWEACVNRLYYACFYAVSGLPLDRGFSSSRHNGVRTLFNQHLVRTGEVSRELARIYNDLFERRQESDYLDFVRFDEERVRPWLAQAERFVEAMRRLAAPDASSSG